MAGFGLPNFGQLTEAFRKAQQIQQDAQKLQQELEAMELEGQSADGRVSIWLSGNQQPLKVSLAPELLQEGSSASEAAVLEALQAAYAGRAYRVTCLQRFQHTRMPLSETHRPT
jgi:DNA-binding YbaB/EbfC family protein